MSSAALGNHWRPSLAVTFLEALLHQASLKRGGDGGDNLLFEPAVIGAVMDVQGVAHRLCR